MRDNDTIILEKLYEASRFEIMEGEERILDIPGVQEYITKRYSPTRAEEDVELSQDALEALAKFYTENYPDVYHGFNNQDPTPWFEERIERVLLTFPNVLTDIDMPEDDMSDVEADADTLASAGYGTDEDYGYYGGEE